MKDNPETNYATKGDSEVEEYTPVLKIASYYDVSQSHLIDYVPLYQISSSSTMTTEVNIDLKKVAENAGTYFVPPSRFHNLTISNVNKSQCHGTLAFYCRKLKEIPDTLLSQSMCTTSRDDWWGIHKMVYQLLTKTTESLHGP